MKCPNCNHESTTALFKCPACHESYDRAELEHLNSLEFLIRWLNEREKAGEVSGADFERLWTRAIGQRDQVQAALHLGVSAPVITAIVAVPSLPAAPPAAPVMAPPVIKPLAQPETYEGGTPARTMALLIATRDALTVWNSNGLISQSSLSVLRSHLSRRLAQLAALSHNGHSLPKVTPEAVRTYQLSALDGWVKVDLLQPAEAERVRQHLSLAAQPKPAQAAASLVVAAPAPKPAAPAKPAKPVVPAKPPAPPIDWGKVWERVWGLVVSGALLRGLLYLGAFMIVVSAIVLVVAYWRAFSPLLQIGFITAVPLSFYAGGFLLRTRLKIPVAGGVITGIGAVLVAVDFAAVYQLGVLTVPLDWYWLAGSLVCSLIYVLTALRVKGEFFAYLTLLGLGSSLVAVAAILAGRRPEWWLAAAAAASTAMMSAAVWLQRRPRPALADIHLAALRLPHLLTPLSLFLMLLVPTLPSVGSQPAAGQMAGFGLAALGYGLLTVAFPQALLAYLSVGASLGALWFGFQAFHLPWQWQASAAALAAAAYWSGARPATRTYRTALNLTGFILAAAAAVAGLLTAASDVWPGVIGLTLTALALAWAAVLMRRPVLTFLAAGLFLAPYTIGLFHQLLIAPTADWIGWGMAGWAGLSLAYLGLMALLRKVDRHAAWLALWAHGLGVASLGGMVVSYFHSLLDTRSAAWTNTASLATLGLVAGLYVASAWLHDSGRHPALSSYFKWLPATAGRPIFLWPSGAALALWVAVAWWGLAYSHAWVGAVWAGLALAYLGAGRLLGRRAQAYMLPARVMAYGLMGLAVLFSLGERLPLAAALYLAAAGLGLSAWLYRSDIEAALAGALFVWPFHLSLSLLGLPLESFSLGYALLAALGYTPLGIALARVGRRIAYPQHAIGYGVAAAAVAASLGGRLGYFPYQPEWVGVAAPLVVCALFTFSVYHFRQSGFAWAAAAVLPITYGQALGLLRVPPEYDAAAWVLLAFGYLLAERGLATNVSVGSWLDRARARSAAFRWPLGLGAGLLATLGLLLTADSTALAFAGRTLADYTGPIAAQCLALMLVVSAARLHRSRWPLFLTAPLAFLAVSLFFIGYGASLLHMALTPPQFGPIWSILGLVVLAAAVWLDTSRARYSQGLYLGGYALVVWAVAWTVVARDQLLITLGLAIAVCAVSAALVHYRRHQTWSRAVAFVFGRTETPVRLVTRDIFLWLAAWATPVWCVLLLRQFNVADGFYWLGFSLPALAGLGLAVWFKRLAPAYAWPFHSAAQFYTALGLALSLPISLQFLSGQFVTSDWRYPILHLSLLGLTVVQSVGVVFYAASAKVLRRPAFAYAAAWLSFVPYTLLWIAESHLDAIHFGLAWSGLALTHLAIAVWLGRERAADSGGPYSSGYAIALLAVLWTVTDPGLLVYTLGAVLAASVISAILVHLDRHAAAVGLLNYLLRSAPDLARRVARGMFLWVAAWVLPVWTTVLLLALHVPDGFSWLGLAAPALVLLSLAVWLRRFERTYAWPFNSAAHFYTALALVLAAPAALRLLAGLRFGPDLRIVPAVILVGALAVAAYAFSAWSLRRRAFAHLAAWLAFVPYSLAWLRYSSLTETERALPWLGLAVVMTAAGYWLDRVERGRAGRVGYGHGPYLAGYAFAAWALLWSAPDQSVNLLVLAGVIVLALASHLAVHYGRHDSFADLMAWLWQKRAPGSSLQRGLRSAFLFCAVYAFPFWLAEFMDWQQVPLAWRGLGLALVAPIYVAFGLASRRTRAEYAWPFYTAGYTLTAVGAMLSFQDERLAIGVLVLDAAVYAASAYIFRQAAWLALANTLTPVIGLLVLHYNGLLTPAWAAGLLMGLAWADLAAGLWFNRSAAHGRVGPFALACLAPAYVLSALAMASSSGESSLAIGVYTAGAGLYALSAWVFRESIFLYPAVVITAVPYYLLMPRLGVPSQWLGLGWLPLILVSLGLGRFVFHRRPLTGWRQTLGRFWSAGAADGPAQNPFTHPALPFYLLVYTLSVSMIVLSRASALTLTAGLAAAAGLYFGSAALFRRAAWLYPGLLAAHAGFLTYFAIHPTDAPAAYISLPFMGFTWLVAWIGYAFSRRSPGAGTGLLRLVARPSWAQPFVLFAGLDVFMWQAVALGHPNSAIIVATSFMLLLFLLASLWQSLALAYASLVFLLLAVGVRLETAGLALSEAFAVFGALGFGLYLTGWLAGRTRLDGLGIWPRPLGQAAVVLAALGVAVTLPFVIGHHFDTAAALASAGALSLTIAIRGRRARLGYLGMAMLEAAWALILAFGWQIAQPELYSLPAGLYFTGVGYFERGRSRKLFAVTIETFGLAVMLLTAFVLSLNGGAEGLPHFIILVVAGLGVIWWGASRRIKAPFFIGLAASALNVAGQIVVLFSGGELLLRFVIIGAAGLVIVAAAVLVERQRAAILVKAQEWREALEHWD